MATNQNRSLASGIRKRLKEAYDYIARGDSEAALTPLANAIEAVSGGGRAKYKNWLSLKMPIISCCILDGGPSAVKLILPIRTANRQITLATSDGTAELQEIVYHLIRCALDHTCSVDPALMNTNECSIHWDGAVLHLSFAKLSTGLLLSLVTDLSEEDSPHIQGDVNGYPLAHFCGLAVSDALAMVRSLGVPRPLCA